jgi:hypothetical protein
MRSKGVRLVSARADTKKMTKYGLQRHADPWVRSTIITAALDTLVAYNPSVCLSYLAAPTRRGTIPKSPNPVTVSVIFAP